jgi:3-phytase
VLPTFKGKDPYGICSYRSAKSGKGYFFVADKSGKIEQHELFSREGKIGSRLVRSFAVSSQAEGCVCDDEQGVFYLAEEDVGIWRFAAEPDAETKGKLIAKVGEHGLKADVEGLALFCGKDGKGYLIASSQGNNTFKIYRRDGNNEFVRTIDPIAGKFSKPTDTDGIAVTNRALGRVFPKGLFVVQDGNKKDDTKGKQNFLFYAWEEIAGPCSKDDKSDTGLLIDTQWSPRRTR